MVRAGPAPEAAIMNAAAQAGPTLAPLWVYLKASPLLWLALTCLAYAIADRLSAASGRHPLVNPVLLAVAFVATLLVATGTRYEDYFEGAQFVHFLLGPATVALALPLYRNRAAVRRALLPIAAALIAGSVTAIVTAASVALALGVPSSALVSLLPKSVTAAIAMGISRELGGDAALTASLVILTGIIGAIMVTPLLNAIGVRDWRARGFAAGLAAHGIGTARAFQVNAVAGTFAGIALGLNGLLTAVIVPVILKALSLAVP
jgi:predicted murein hydrolase (TIGR00659 family)